MEQSLFSLKTKVHYKAIVLCNAALKKPVCKFTVYGKDDLNQQTVILSSSMCQERKM